MLEQIYKLTLSFVIISLIFGMITPAIAQSEDEVVGDLIEEVQLDLQPDKTTVDAGESVTFTVTRSDNNKKVDAELQVAGEIAAKAGSDGKANITFDETGTYTVDASKLDLPEIDFLDDTVNITVQKDKVGLSLSVNKSPVTVNDSVLLTVERKDTNEGVKANLDIEGKNQVNTGENGKATVEFDESGTHEITATKPDTPTTDFITDKIDLPVQPPTLPDQPDPANLVPVSIDAPKTINLGEKLTATATLKNTGDSPGSFSVEFKVDGKIVAIKQIDLEAGGQTDVSFDQTPTQTGQYNISIAGLTYTVLVEKVQIDPSGSTLNIESTTGTPGGNIGIDINATDVGAISLPQIPGPLSISDVKSTADNIKQRDIDGDGKIDSLLLEWNNIQDNVDPSIIFDIPENADPGSIELPVDAEIPSQTPDSDTVEQITETVKTQINSAINQYDLNNDGLMQSEEVRDAIKDYLFTDEIGQNQITDIIDNYLFGPAPSSGSE